MLNLNSNLIVMNMCILQRKPQPFCRWKENTPFSDRSFGHISAWSKKENNQNGQWVSFFWLVALRFVLNQQMGDCPFVSSPFKLGVYSPSVYQRSIYI